MISSLQPNRPKAPPPYRSLTTTCPSAGSHFLPIGHQQIRHEHATLQALQPRSQIEAMPPYPPMLPVMMTAPPPPMLPQGVTSIPVPQYDSAMRHPVFFTEKWRRPAFQVPDGGGAGGIFNPVAQGYMFEGSRRLDVSQQTRTKL